LTPRAARLASSSIAPCRVGTVRWHAHARRVATASTLPVQLTIPTPTYGQNSHPSRALHGARCCPRCALRHASARSLCRRAEPSPPSLLAQARVASTHYAAIKEDLPCAFCSCPHRCLPLVSRRRRTASVFRHSVGAKPPHPTSLPVRRSWSSAGPQSYSQTSSSNIFFAVELRHHRLCW
jgi:hypothetical protein